MKRAFPPAALALLSLFAPFPVRADEPSWLLSGDVVALSAPVLPGVVIGGALQAQRSLSGPWYALARIAAGQASDANETWDLWHTHLLATVGAGWGRVAGAALFGAELQVGALAILETARRHQFERLEANDIPDRERTAQQLAPWLVARGSIGVELVPGWRAQLSLGPELTWVNVAGTQRLRGGVSSGIGVQHAF